MKICHVHLRNFLSTKGYTWGLKGLAKKGHQVTLICGGNTQKRRVYFEDGIRVIELPLRINISPATGILKSLVPELMKIKTDVFHVRHYQSFLPEITAIVAKFRSIPIVLSVHSTFREGQKWYIKYPEFIYSILIQPFLPLFSKIIFISNYVKNGYTFNLIPEKKKRVIYNCISTYEINKSEKVKRDKYTILYIGRQAKEKGVDILLRAIALIKNKCPSIRLIIAGDRGRINDKREIRYLIKKLALKDKIIFTGWLDGRKKWELMQKSTIIVVPSRNEALGMTAVEGLAAGVPLIVSDAGALPEVVGEYGLIFKNGDIKDLADKLTEALRGNVKMSGALDYVLDKFGEEKMINRLIKIYSDISTKK